MKQINNQQATEDKMHKKTGYILLLLFSILSVCTIILSLFFARTHTYQNLMHLLSKQEQATHLALSCTSFGKSLLTVTDKDKQQSEQKETDEKTVLKKIIPYTNNNKSYKITEEQEGINANVEMSLSFENGKININSLYDFQAKKFINEGQQGDRKKFCQWLFDSISKINQKASLFTSFEKYLAAKDGQINDVTELLTIKEFAETFGDYVFYKPSANEQKNIYLTDLFTISTEQEVINPWLFSHSWCTLLGLSKKNDFSDDDLKKIISSFKKQANWEKDWDTSLKTLYQKEYKNLPQEIKSMLTTEYEANIFSLLLNAIIGETTSTIFTILKKHTHSKTATFDIIKVYQI